MCIADLNREIQGRYASSADMTVWSVNAGQVGGYVAGVKREVVTVVVFRVAFSVSTSLTPFAALAAHGAWSGSFIYVQDHTNR